MSGLRLRVSDTTGDREVTLDRFPFAIGRRETNHLRLAGSEVSREHAEIVEEAGRLLLRDRASRYGTFVNDEQVTECEVRTGDRIRLGVGGGAELVVLPPQDAPSSGTIMLSGSPGLSPRDDLRQITALLAGFRNLGSGRVLQDVLALVLDASLELSGAERAFIMLATPAGTLEFRQARGRGKQSLTDATFATSRKIPEEVFTSGKVKVVADLMDAGTAGAHMGTVALGIRHVVCVPLHFVQYVESAEAKGEDRRIGVLYLDSRERGSLASDATRAALETLASEASVAIENARLYRDKLEKAKMEHEMRVAADIQQALLPKPPAAMGFIEAAASSVPCRSIGGDFFDYLSDSATSFGFTLGDVAGKGPPAALLSALMQGMFSAFAYTPDGPSTAVTRINKALYRRGIEARFVTIMLASVTVDGRLTYTNGGHNPPFIIGSSGVRRLEAGGPVIGLLEHASFTEETVQLDPGDVVIIFSDGVSEAMNAAGDEFGDDRLLEVAEAGLRESVHAQVERIIAAVKKFATGAPQSDDITVMVLRYLGATGS